jgi:peptide-methionine (S)-S-oxide reductase
LSANGAKFGPGYWKTFGPAPGCTINVPNAPVTLEEALAAN